MNQNTFCSQCHRIPSQCCCGSVKELNEEFEKGFKAGKEEGWKAHKFHQPVKELTDEVYFCSRCGKRLGDGIHTCTPPTDILRKAQEK